jgi:predicted enzyme related to lactoylglutathione lyase
METVLGFGGFFFRSKDPAGLSGWYRDHLGVSLVPQGPDDMPWIAEGGPTIFSPFADDTDYFAANRSFMLNFRVADLGAMIAQLEAAGIAVKRLDDMPGIGKFAHLTDPEGTPIELWEPAAGPE